MLIVGVIILINFINLGICATPIESLYIDNVTQSGWMPGNTNVLRNGIVTPGCDIIPENTKYHGPYGYDRIETFNQRFECTKDSKVMVSYTEAFGCGQNGVHQDFIRMAINGVPQQINGVNTFTPNGWCNIAEQTKTCGTFMIHDESVDIGYWYAGQVFNVKFTIRTSQFDEISIILNIQIECIESIIPTNVPTSMTRIPSVIPTQYPTGLPSNYPTEIPTNIPTNTPTSPPTEIPTIYPSLTPSGIPTELPTTIPSVSPTQEPTIFPSNNPTETPTNIPSVSPIVPTQIEPLIDIELFHGWNIAISCLIIGIIVAFCVMLCLCILYWFLKYKNSQLKEVLPKKTHIKMIPTFSDNTPGNIVIPGDNNDKLNDNDIKIIHKNSIIKPEMDNPNIKNREGLHNKQLSLQMTLEGE